MSAPCPLAVMEDHINQLCVESPEDQRHLEAMTEARAAVAELVEADREYDAARLAMNSAMTWGESEAAWDRSLAAFNRRAAALAKFGGAA